MGFCLNQNRIQYPYPRPRSPAGRNRSPLRLHIFPIFHRSPLCLRMFPIVHRSPSPIHVSDPRPYPAFVRFDTRIRRPRARCHVSITDLGLSVSRCDHRGPRPRHRPILRGLLLGLLVP